MTMAEKPYEYLLKVIVVGNSSVGKSCLLLQFVDKRFRANHEITIGVEFGCRVLEAGGWRFKVHVWDTAGQESFRSITRNYYRTAAVALLVYDVTNRSSFEHLRQWMTEVSACAAPSVSVVLVANKTDLSERRVVSEEEGLSLAEELGALYRETSALTSRGVDEAFTDGCVQAIERSRQPGGAAIPGLVQRLRLEPAPVARTAKPACC